MKMCSMRFYILLLVSCGLLAREALAINSYIYLTDKSIREEIAVGTLVADLPHELGSNKLFQKQFSSSASGTGANSLVSGQQYTLLDDSKLSNGNAFFKLDPASGILTTKRFIDRESMCLNRQCAEPCEMSAYDSSAGVGEASSVSTAGSCKINLKILLMPSYNILNLNVYVEDVNDNKPLFRTSNITQRINENVPIGYKIPIDLAYDPDAGRNGIQRYELTDSPLNTREQNELVRKTFRLAQNLNESQLHLVVIDKLDRETVASYNFTITAVDGGQPALNASVNGSIEIVDINDNNPVFERTHYKFSLYENMPLETLIGQVKAHDLDEAANGQVRYSFAESAMHSNGVGMNGASRFFMQRGGGGETKQNFAKYFDLDENSGVIRLKAPLDFEQDAHFVLTVEAKDLGVGSLPSYATVEIEVLDVNDNAPEIVVSILNSLYKNASLIDGYKYDVHLPENTKANKFIAHVSMFDKDSSENGRFDWKILVNDHVLETSYGEPKTTSGTDSLLKLIRLNNNSFTLNIGSAALMDREKFARHNISLLAWDYGTPMLNTTFYNFSLVLIDVNDNAPKFERTSYELSIAENNEPFDVIYTFEATDADESGPSSNVSYSIKEAIMNDYLYIDPYGNLRSKVSFDREKIEKFIFHVVATDHGQPQLSTTVLVTLNIVDLNDNSPQIYFNTSYYHRYFNAGRHESSSSGSASGSRVSASEAEAAGNAPWLLVRVGESLPVNSKIVDFRATDRDMNENAQYEYVFGMQMYSAKELKQLLPFRLSPDGQLTLSKPLDKLKQNTYELVVVCRDFGKQPERLNTTLRVVVEVVDSNEYCIRSITNVSNENRTRFVNRDQLAAAAKATTRPAEAKLFAVDFSVSSDAAAAASESLQQYQAFIINDKEIMSFELLTHKDIIEIGAVRLNQSTDGGGEVRYRLSIGIRSDLQNLTRIMLGKYTIKINVFDNRNPTCNKLEQFTLLIGNNFINEKDINEFLLSLKTKQQQQSGKNKNPMIASKKKVASVGDGDSTEQASSKETDNIDKDVLGGYDDASSYYGSGSGGRDSSGEEELYLNEKLSGNRVSPRVKPARFLVKSDYVLLVILVVIIVITAVFLAFVGIICFYTRYKKQYNSSGGKRSSSASNKKKQQAAALPSLISQDDTDETTNNTSSNLSPNSSSPNSSIILTSRHLNELDNINEMDSEESAHLKYKSVVAGRKQQQQAEKQAAKAKKMRKSGRTAGNKDSLNSSTGSGSMSGSTNSTDSSSTKPQYVLVNNSGSSGAASSSSSSTTNGVLLYRDADDDDADDDEFGLLSHPPSCAIRQFTSNTIRERERQQQRFHAQQQHHPHQLQIQQHQHTTALSSSRYIHPSLAMAGQATMMMSNAAVSDSYESSHRSNSAAESIVESMTIDDSKSNNSNQEYEPQAGHKYLSAITNKYRSDQSSAYSSITTSGHASANVNNLSSAMSSCLDSDPFNKLNSLVCMNYEDAATHKLPAGKQQTMPRRAENNTSLLSFRKTPTRPNDSAAHSPSGTYNRSQTNGGKHVTRTSFNL